MSLCLEKRGRRLGGGRLEGGGGARAVCQLQFQVASVFAVVLRTIKVRENLMLIELNLQTMPQWAAGYSREIGQENRRKIEGGVASYHNDRGYICILIDRQWPQIRITINSITNSPSRTISQDLHRIARGAKSPAHLSHDK
uniref:HDC17817 n=1 Tax=Drosophila melanogaster TaxID=7227 RepID=Q6IIK1_DROME|nr:TPA_inf: HDC17817 [Drosophila melanogaster]